MGNIKIFDLEAEKCRVNLKSDQEIGIRSISIASNAFCLVAADSAGVCNVWTLKEAEELIPLQKFQAHNDYILKCLISPDIKSLATCSADKTIKLWTLAKDKGYVLSKTLYGHSKWVWDCAFSCDSDFILSGSSDGTAKIWLTETGEIIRNFKGHKKEIAIETLSLNNNEIQIKGIFAILSYFYPELLFNLKQLDLLYYLLFQLIEKVAHPKKPNVNLKVIKNRKYKDVEGLMESITDKNQYFSIVAYIVLRKYYQQNEKTQKQFPKLSKWIGQMNELERDIKELSETYNIKTQGTKEQKAQKKNKEAKPTPINPVQNQKKEKPKLAKKQLPQLTEDQIKHFQSLKINRLTKSQVILPSSNRRNVLITSALPYVNNVPHLGNIIGCVLSADVFARYCRLRNYNTIYICGTDEYGTATEMKALQEKMTPKQICDKYFKIHKEIYEWFDMDFDYFGRTTTEQQTEIAQDIFMQLYKNKLLDEGQIEQFYCNNCKTYLADRFIKGVCPHCSFDDAKGDQCDSCQKLLNPAELISPQCNICKETPELKQSTHIFLDLPQCQEKLQKWINKASVDGDWNQNSISTTASWLKGGLKKRCITRDLKWGTPVPLEKFKEKVFYVWFDAPIGYLSITANYTKEWEQWWKNPEQVKLYQFMGKDNIPFHTVIFPSSLIGSYDNWTLLHHISTTEYLNYENLKFSKTRGTGIFGDGVQDTGIPVEVWRYYLLVNRPETKDTVFQWKDFQAKNNCELLMNVGNLVQRTLKFVKSKYNSKVPTDISKINENDQKFINEIYKDFLEYVKAMEKVEIKEGLKISMQISSKINKFIQDEKPWEKEQKRSDEIIFIAVNLIRLISAIFEPFMPSLSAKINWMLGFDRNQTDETLLEWILQKGQQGLVELVKKGQEIREVQILFVEYDDEFIEKMAKKYSGQQK